MTNHIDPDQMRQAKEWAETVNHYDDTYNREELTIAGLIANLPDQIIDADKVRELLDRWAVNPFPTSDEVAVLNDVESLLPTPKPKTLDDLIEQGHDPAEYQWAQADHRDERCVIIRVLGHDSKLTVSLLTATGATIWVSPDEVIPLPDLPCLVWPASEPEPAEETPDEPERTYAPGGVVVQEALDKLNTPEPQEGEAWEVVYAIAGSEPFNVIYGNNGNAFNFRGSQWKQAELIPMHRLVPEVVPKVLTTEEDYRNAPYGTVIAEGKELPFFTDTWAWCSPDGIRRDHRDLAGTPRRILRWGMGEQA